MSTSFCDRYDYHRIYGRYPEDEQPETAAPAGEVEAKVVAEPKKTTVRKSRVAETKSE